MIDELGENKEFFEIIKSGTGDNTYYEIKYRERVTNEIHIGYSSYSLKWISRFLKECFGL